MLMRTTRSPRVPAATGRLRPLLAIFGAAIFVSATMTAVLAGPASAGTLPSGGPICLVNHPAYCLYYNPALAIAELNTTSTGTGAENWYTEYVGQTAINGTEWDDYYISTTNSFSGNSSHCLTVFTVNASVGTGPCGANGTVWVWSADANGNDLVSRYFLNNGNYQDLCAFDLSQFEPLLYCSYGSGYFRWAEE
jgi:hypothetical protein